MFPPTASICPRFDPRSRAGSDFTDLTGLPLYSTFRSTLPRGERRWRGPLGDDIGPVSIHAPARGATDLVGHRRDVSAVSIHAPARGATRSGPGGPNPGKVSIHAPARGATRSRGRPSAPARCFDPRSHAGSDISLWLTPPHLMRFDPRSHAGSDHSISRSSETQPGFDPRSHAGSDAFWCGLNLGNLKFRSTLPRGERRDEHRQGRHAQAVSIHAPTRGATPDIQIAMGL